MSLIPMKKKSGNNYSTWQIWTNACFLHIYSLYTKENHHVQWEYKDGEKENLK